MRKVSNKNTYSDSDDNRWTRQQIKTKSDKAKGEVLEEQIDEYGYNFCVECKKNAQSSGKLDCSHTISEKWAMENHQAELCWCKKNIRPRCRDCHKKLDGL